MEYSRYHEPDWRPRGDPSLSRSRSAITWLVLGVGVGTGLALLLAPTSGSELRSAIGRGFRRTFEGISRGTRELRDRGTNLLNFTRRRSG